MQTVQLTGMGVLHKKAKKLTIFNLIFCTQTLEKNFQLECICNKVKLNIKTPLPTLRHLS